MALLQFVFNKNIFTNNALIWARQAVLDPDGIHYWETWRQSFGLSTIFYIKFDLATDTPILLYQLTQGGSSLLGEGGFFVDDTYIYVFCRTKSLAAPFYDVSTVKTFLKSTGVYQNTYTGAGWDAAGKPAFSNLGLGWYYNNIWAIPCTGHQGDSSFINSSIILYNKTTNAFTEVLKGSFPLGYVTVIHDGTYLYTCYYGAVNAQVSKWTMAGAFVETINTGYQRAQGLAIHNGQLFVNTYYIDGVAKMDIASYDLTNGNLPGPVILNTSLQPAYVMAVNDNYLYKPGIAEWLTIKYTVQFSPSSSISYVSSAGRSGSAGGKARRRLIRNQSYGDL